MARQRLILLLKSFPLIISSTRRGDNGLRNADELADAVLELISNTKELATCEAGKEKL